MLAAALSAIYVVLGVLYESYSQPLTILSTLPSAGVGALLALMATGTEFSLIAFLGILLLIGIVKKNAIMMVDFALEAERTLGMDPMAAIAHACSLRFRPIMMTTCAAIAGALPLAIASGDGTEMRRPLGISIVGGLIVSQLLTIYTTPVVYLYVHRYWKRKSIPGKRRPRATPATAQRSRLRDSFGSMLRIGVRDCTRRFLCRGARLSAACLRNRLQLQGADRLEAERAERCHDPRTLVGHLQG